MSEKMLVTQALDERDLLVKKINDKINKASFTDTKKHNEEKVAEGKILSADFEKDAKSALQQIQDLIERYNKIDEAIVASNAATKIQTSYGEYTVAGAIALRSRMRGEHSSSTDFEKTLYDKMSSERNKRLLTAELKNKELETTAQNMRISILGRDAKNKDDKPLEVVETYVKENTTELVDPLNIQSQVDKLDEKRSKLLTELDTQIKVSNATTFIEI